MPDLEYKDSIAWKKFGTVFIMINYEKEGIVLRTIDRKNHGKEYGYLGTSNKDELFSIFRDRKLPEWPTNWEEKEPFKIEEA
jgi:hypothetical protein